jgi:hypothetical protein
MEAITEFAGQGDLRVTSARWTGLDEGEKGEGAAVFKFSAKD